MSRLAPLACVIVLSLPLASCVQSPDSAGGAPAGVSPRPVDATVGADAGGLLLREESMGSWCTCEVEPAATVVRQGSGLKFRWASADPVVADRYAEYRFTADGVVVVDWGTTHEWPSGSDEEILWFPEVGEHAVRVEKELGGQVTSLEVFFSVVPAGREPLP